MILKLRSRKSWRHFSKRKKSKHTIRKICYGALVLEAAFLIRDLMASGIYVSEEVLRETVFTEENSKEESAILEQYFGVHVRIKEGVIEFYRKEEAYRKADESVYPDER